MTARYRYHNYFQVYINFNHGTFIWVIHINCIILIHKILGADIVIYESLDLTVYIFLEAAFRFAAFLLAVLTQLCRETCGQDVHLTLFAL